MNNLSVYEKVRKVPPEALKKITGGRLNGMSDINPMWRIKTLTEAFGMCGVGWKYEIVNQWLEDGVAGEKMAFTQINLFVKDGDKWSEAIPGIGGSSFISKERNGLYASDECFKMSLTDAISVSCKALGVGADVYFEKDKTKYTPNEPSSTDNPKIEQPIELSKIEVDTVLAARDLEELKRIWEVDLKMFQRNPNFIQLVNKRKNELKQK